MPHKDPEERRAYNREYQKRWRKENGPAAQRHRAMVKANNEKYAKRNAAIVLEFKANGCELCDEKEPCCLDAHHRDPDEKDFGIASVSRNGFSEQRLRDELAKCICVCSNCHRKIHAGIIAGVPSG